MNMERRPFAYCCAAAGGHVEACDCVNKDHGFALFSTKAAPVVANPETSTEEYAKAKVEMLSLLNSIWNVEYRNTAPCRGPLDDLSGMVSQLESMYVRVRNERDALRADIAALQARSAEPASNPCKLPAEPAGDEPVAWMIRDTAGNLAGIVSREGKRRTDDERSRGWTETPLYARPATPTNPERLVTALRGLYAAVNARAVRGRDHVPAMREEQKAMLEALKALSAAPLKEGEAA